MKHIIQLKGDDVVDFVFGVKGGVQSYVKHTGKFPSAAYKMHKREGTIEVENVDRATLANAVNKAVSSIQGKRIDYEIVEVETPAPPEGPDVEESSYTYLFVAVEPSGNWLRTEIDDRRTFFGTSVLD